VGTSRGGRDTVDGEETCVTAVNGGAVWKGDDDRGHGRSGVLKIMFHFEKVVSGTRAYNGRWGWGCLWCELHHYY
jgi:hypothetical protein